MSALPTRAVARRAPTLTIPTLAQLSKRGKLGRTFTLRQLQAAVALDAVRPVHKAAFRRMLHQLGAVVPTTLHLTTGRGRPAELFTWADLSPEDAAAVAYRLAQWRFAR